MLNRTWNVITQIAFHKFQFDTFSYSLFYVFIILILIKILKTFLLGPMIGDISISTYKKFKHNSKAYEKNKNDKRGMIKKNG